MKARGESAIAYPRIEHLQGVGVAAGVITRDLISIACAREGIPREYFSARVSRFLSRAGEAATRVCVQYCMRRRYFLLLRRPLDWGAPKSQPLQPRHGLRERGTIAYAQRAARLSRCGVALLVLTQTLPLHGKGLSMERAGWRPFVSGTHARTHAYTCPHRFSPFLATRTRKAEHDVMTVCSLRTLWARIF